MTEAMEESKRMHKEQKNINRFYARIAHHNLVKLCEKHYSTMPPQSPDTDGSRRRMTKEIAEELIAWHGPMAAMHCLEALVNEKSHPQMWRDVMAWIKELQGEENGSRSI